MSLNISLSYSKSFKVIVIGTTVKQPYVYLGIEPYIVCVFTLICSVYIFARFA